MEGLVIVDWLRDRACTRVYEAHPENFTFDFGEGNLAVDCLWRIIEGGRLSLTSYDHGRQYGLPAPIDAHAEAEAILLGRRVAGSRLREGTADLFLEFDGDVQLEVIAESSGYEPWKFRAPGVWLIALGGGGVADFSTDEWGKDKGIDSL